ncbi:MAG: hypothetical protein AB1724_07250 [Thermodesulfobacteriota bacterium]
MSGNSIFKPIYDQYAVNLFLSNNWGAFSVKKNGWYCDVLAIRNSEVALVEVKSPAEGSTGPKYDDMKGLKPNLSSQFPVGFPQRRKLIMNNITAPHGGISLVKLYAVGIACQLYRYKVELETKRLLYQSAISGLNLPQSGQYQLSSHFAVPFEAKQQCSDAVDFLSQEHIVNLVSENEDCKIYCVCISFV